MINLSYEPFVQEGDRGWCVGQPAGAGQSLILGFQAITTAALAVSDASDGGRVLILFGRLDSVSVTRLWESVRKAVADAQSRRVVVDTKDVDYCDGAGIAPLVTSCAIRAYPRSRSQISSPRSKCC